MDTCNVCHKHRHEVDENGVCEKCLKTLARMKTRLEIEYSNSTRAIPFGKDKKILTKAQWSRIKSAIDNYYNSVSSDEIDEANIELNRIYPKRKYAPSKTRRGAVPGFIYLLDGSNGCFKIGRAADVDKRLGQHMREFPLKISLIHTIATADMVLGEAFLLSKFSGKKAQGEWFFLDNDEICWIHSLDGHKLDSLAAEWNRERA